jgi:serine phosphatase RsbU (regulator of sigma subunit)
MTKRAFGICFYYLLVFFLGVGNLVAQRAKLDSLLKVEKSYASKGDSTHITILCKLCSLYESVHLDSSQLLGQQAVELSKAIDYKPGLAKGLSCIGYYYNAKGNYEQSLEYFIQSKKILESIKDYEAMSEAFNAIGNCYIGYGKTEKALEAYLEGYEIAVKYAFKNKQSIVAIGVGNSYVELGQYEKALDYFFIAKSIFEEQKAGYLISFSTLCIANALSGLDRYEEAFEYYHAAIKVLEEINHPYGKAAAYQEVATTYQKVKDFDQAIHYYKKAILLFEERKAFDNLKKIHLALARCYAEKKEYEKAYWHHLDYAAYNDSILNENVSRQLLEIEGKYEAEKKQQEIELQQVMLSEKDAKLAEESMRANLLYVLIGVVLFILFIFLNGYLNKRKNNLRLSQINQQLEHKNKVIEEKSKEILDSINYAKTIQNAIIPPLESIKHFLPESFVLYLPKDIVAGDFYWIEQRNNWLFFAVADCTGHGVPGAMVSVVCSNALNRAVKEFALTSTADILNKTREMVLESFNTTHDNIKDGMDISLIAMPMNESATDTSRKVMWSGANIPLWLVRKQTHSIEEIKADKQPIGLSHTFNPFTQHEITLYQGDLLYLFTDGFADQFGGNERSNGKKFMYKRLKEVLLSVQELPVEVQKNTLLNRFNQWKGEFEQVDDVCIMGVKF